MKRLLVIAVVVLGVSLALGAASVAEAGKGHRCKADPETCAAKLKAKYETKAWLGVELDKSEHGYYTVTKVISGSPAEAAGFQAGDVLLAMNGVKMSDKEKVKKVKRSIAIGDQVTYVVKREGEKVELSATLTKAPEALIASWVDEHISEAHDGASRKG